MVRWSSGLCGAAEKINKKIFRIEGAKEND
jgi:hypothetical protein